MLRGRVAEAKGDTDAARRAYEAAASDATEGFGARLRLAAIDFDAGDEAEAVRGLEGIRAGHEGHPELVSLLVRALLAEGEKERAAEVVRAGRRENPDDLRIQSAEADVYIARGLYEEALTALGRLVEAQPNDASLQVSLGRAALKAEELDRADGAFARALELEAGIRGALLGKVELAALRGNTDAMESALSAADQGGVPAAQLRRWRAELALLRGQGREAVALFEPLAGRRRTRDPVLITRLGQAQVQAEQCNDALATFRRLRRRPNVDSLVGSAYCETRRARFGPARRAIDRAAQLARSDRERARVSVARGFFAFENGNLGDARSAAESALEQDASSSEAHFLMGMVTDAQGSDEAVNHFRRAVESRMPSPEAMGQLILHMRGRRTERCQLIERYQRADPRGIDARDIERVAERCR